MYRCVIICSSLQSHKSQPGFSEFDLCPETQDPFQKMLFMKAEIWKELMVGRCSISIATDSQRGLSEYQAHVIVTYYVHLHIQRMKIYLFEW